MPGSSYDEMEQPSKEQTNFLAMPPEIRNKIYLLSLVAPSPITVWSAQFPRPRGLRQLRVPHRLEWDREAMASSVRNLALSLLRCNRTVAPEVASIFYGKNIFSFHGDHDYLPVIAWLDAIGEKNRGYLTKLEVSVRIPSRAWQRRDGTRQRVPTYSSNEFFPRNSHFIAPSESSPEGEVDNINPAIETILSIFGRCDGGPKLTLLLNLGFDVIPGVILITQREGLDSDHFSMDLPNLIEKWRLDYTSDSRCRPIEVRWKAESYRELFTEGRGLIEAQGWEILEEEEAERLQFTRMGPPNEYPRYLTMRFLLRRKELTGPLVAADPNPHSWRKGPETFE